MSQKGPPQTTVGPSLLLRQAKNQRAEVNTTGQIRNTLHILQWNAEGVLNKKTSLQIQLHEEQMDATCIQETHLNSNHRCSVRDIKHTDMIEKDTEGACA